MADGTFAAVLLIAGLTDMSLNYCGTEVGCLGHTEVQPRNAFSAGSVVYQWEQVGGEVYFRRDFGFKTGPFGNAFGISITNEGSAWIGYGQTLTYSSRNGRSYVELHAMTGLYARGNGVDLGGPLEFRSGVEVGFEARNGVRYGLSYDHRSNAALHDFNPGLETFQVRVSVPSW